MIMADAKRESNQKFVESMIGNMTKKEVPLPTDKRRELTDDEVQNVEKAMEQLKKGKLLRK
jgi:hypothetical protein